MFCYFKEYHAIQCIRSLNSVLLNKFSLLPKLLETIIKIHLNGIEKYNQFSSIYIFFCMELLL